MNPITATLSGAIGIHAGLNRDSITLDLSSIPDDALTVAIRGDNGMGKSTILNLALTPWREPPQIAGTLYDQFGPAGLRELTWTHGGETYRSRIEIKQSAKTKTQKATLQVMRGDKWEPVRLPDNTVSDGKSSTYDACLTYILGPQDLYYLAAFRAQNAPKLAEHSDPKGLMRALLALNEPAELSDQARDVARELKRHHALIKGQAEALEGHAERVAELEQVAADIEAGAPQRAEAKLAAANAASIAKAELDRAISGDLDRQRIIEQRAAIAQRLSEAEAAASSAVTTAEQYISCAQERAVASQRAGDATLAALDKDIAATTARQHNAQQILQERAEIEAAEIEAAQLAEQLDGEEKTVEQRRAEIDRLSALAAQIQTLQANRTHAEANGKQQKAQLDELSARAEFVSIVPCRGEGVYANCPSLAEAKAAAGRIAETEAAVAAVRAEWIALNDQINALAQQTAALDSLTRAQSDARSLLANLRTKLQAVRATAAKSATLAMAEQQIAEAQAALADLAERRKDAVAGIDQRRAALDAEIESAERKAKESKENGERAVARIRAELAAIPAPDSDAAVTVARQRLASAEAALAQADAAISKATATLAQHQAEADRLRRDIDKGAAIIARSKELEAEIADWTLLGIGLRGVIDLSIEDAGPGIASLANRLLTDAYGPRFSVRIVTQRTQNNGVTKETFDISVIDADSGIESSLLRKSGGEMVWIDKALTDAVGLYHQESAGQHYECLFADEAEDGLTQERKAQFYAMDRAALALGGYRRKFSISHNPEAWAMADHVIDLNGMKV